MRINEDDPFTLESQLALLDRERADLDRRISHALQRQRFSPDAAAAAQARAEERALLLQLDRLMTRIRAVEGNLLQARRFRPH